MAKNRMNLCGQVLLVWLFQISLFVLIWSQNRNINYNTIPVPTYEVACARYIAGVMMHIAMMNELHEGLQKIKFALNHSWRIENNSLALFAGMLQTSAMVLVSLVSYYVIIAKSNTVIDIAKDFLAMKVISEFDNYLYLEHTKDNPIKTLVESQSADFLELFLIQSTTSTDCIPPEENPNINKFVPLKSTVWVNSYRMAVG
mmetsp:Transcript_3334/g.4452  ORF Transcript_3334/g.4452 Transcript_3334/m.4452 type:complete len:201 (+) Transcript_3334:828-1430(+)